MKASQIGILRYGEPTKKNLRVRCANCSRPLLIQVNREQQITGDWLVDLKNRNKGKILSWKYISYGHFCTLTCGTNYANKIIDKT